MPESAVAGQALSSLVVRDVHVTYGRVRALRGVSLRVEPGQIVAVLGANGAGKSTLMKAIGGLVPVVAGAVEFGGRSLTAAPGYRRTSFGVALVPEGRKIFTPLSVQENVRVEMLADGWAGARALFAERLERVLTIFPALRTRLRTPAGDLSGGQQQMVAIARALMSEPRLLLLDEPSRGLAPRIVEEMFEILLALNERSGVAILIAEQNIREALSIADRAYVLQLGRVAVENTAAALIEDRGIEDVYLGRRRDLAD